jgi:hypothetical protein
MIGINRDFHFNVGSLAALDSIGHQLAPPEAWGKWRDKIASRDIAKHGGLRSLAMQFSNLDDRALGNIQVRVEPSLMIKLTGVYIHVNDHFDASKVDGDKNEAVLSFLERTFDASGKRAEELADQVLGLKDV